ncbi:MAG: FecR domain-containing protein [Pseudomonadota bacterium]
MRLHEKDKIQRVAHEWRAALNSRELTTEQQLDFDVWYQASAEHALAFDKALQTWEALGTLTAQDINPEFLKPTWRERLWSPLRHLATEVAPAPRFASLVLLLATLVGVAYWNFLTTSQTYEYITSRGQVSEFVLEDGSRLTLGAASTLRVELSPRIRQTYLDSGQAFFDVVTDGRPFSVSTPTANIHVSGTAFDVGINQAGTRVAVAEGSVAVSSSDVLPGNAASTYEGQASVSLAAGYAVHVDQSKIGVVESVDVATLGGWRSGRLVYNGVPLAEVIHDANRYQDVPIEVVDPDLERLRVTASFSTDDVITAITNLTHILPIQVDVTEQKISVRKK